MPGLIIFKFYVCVCVCVWVDAHLTCVGMWATWDGSWDLNSGPLPDRDTLLASEVSLKIHAGETGFQREMCHDLWSRLGSFWNKFQRFYVYFYLFIFGNKKDKLIKETMMFNLSGIYLFSSFPVFLYFEYLYNIKSLFCNIQNEGDRCFGWKADFYYIFRTFYFKLLVSFFASVWNAVDQSCRLADVSNVSRRSSLLGSLPGNRLILLFTATSSPPPCYIPNNHPSPPCHCKFFIMST